jgi:hypothetical protein
MLAVQNPPDASRASSTWPISPLRDDELAALASGATPTERARVLREAIEHHRAESRRHARAAKSHRDAVAKLLDLRLEHAVELNKAGWNPGLIGRAYRLTRERVRQLLASTRANDDQGAVA